MSQMKEDKIGNTTKETTFWTQRSKSSLVWLFACLFHFVLAISETRSDEILFFLRGQKNSTKLAPEEVRQPHTALG
jgi:hypothetical protein